LGYTLTMALKVKKSTGKPQTFSQDKYIKALIRAGADPSTAKQALKTIKPKLYDLIPTSEIYQLTKQFLQQAKQERVYLLYQLREAVAQIDSIAFEKYVAQVLRFWGYTTTWNVLVAGRCIEHQVDVVAKKDDQHLLVECKHHRRYHRDSGLGKILELSARLEDINQLNGQPTYSTEQPTIKLKFSQAWLITNTKFSRHAITYAKCRRILLTGWKYGQILTLEQMVQESRIYPLTLFGISYQESGQLAELDIITADDIINQPLPQAAYQIIPKHRWTTIYQQIKLLTAG